MGVAGGEEHLPLTSMIRLVDLTMRLTSGERELLVLDRVSLDVPAGQFLAVVGPSGSGKSTLLGLIAGLDRPSAGEIALDGRPIGALSEDALAQLRGRLIGFVFQSYQLIPTMTAFENVMLPIELAGETRAAERGRALLDSVGLTDRAGHYPAQLSGGEQQRVAIARAFARRPPILLADEPTGNLDQATGRKIIDLLVRLHREQRTTMVLVTHDEELAALADRVITLVDGRIEKDRMQAS